MNVTFEDLEMDFNFIPIIFILKDTIWPIQNIYSFLKHPLQLLFFLLNVVLFLF